MSVLISNLNTIESVKLDIKSAIEAKGVSMSGVSFPDYPSAIASISGGGGYTQKDITEGRLDVTNLNNSASFVAFNAFASMSVQTVNLPKCVSVGNNAFANCRSLSQISLPVCEYIGANAFQSCYSLTKVSLPVCSYIGGSAFQSCRSLSQISLPVCEYIGANAFRGCISLTQISLPACVSLTGGTFGYCSSLSQISLPNLRFIGNTQTTFEHCKSLQSLYLPKLAYLSGPWTFNDCVSLSMVDFPVLLFCNNNYQFERNTNLTDLYINSETYAVPNCFLSTTNTNITSIYTHINNISRFISATGWSLYSDKFVGIGDSNVKMLEYNAGVVGGYTKAIDSNYKLYLNISSADVTSIDFPNCGYIGGITFANCRSLSQISLPVCEYIDREAFIGCTSLSQVSLPVCSYISYSAFMGCISLSQVSLPVCEYIGNYAFTSCTSLSQVSLPVCSCLSYGAFLDCISLSQVYLGSNSVCVLSNSVFLNTPIAYGTGSIYVPASLVSDYKTADKWSAYASRIFAIPEPEPELAFDSTTGLLYGSTSVLNPSTISQMSELGVNKSDIVQMSFSQVSYVAGFELFANCTNLTSVSLPICENIGTQMFENCTSLTYVSIPACSAIDPAGFRSCTALSTINLPVCSTIDLSAFKDTALNNITLGSNAVCSVKSNTFTGTPIAAGTGSIYVPASLVNDYKAANYWSDYSSQIFSIQ